MRETDAASSMELNQNDIMYREEGNSYKTYILSEKVGFKILTSLSGRVYRKKI